MLRSDDLKDRCVKLPSKIPSRSFEKRDLRELVKGMRNAKSYKPEIEKSQKKLAELFIGSCDEYTQFENAIAESYMSGDPTRQREAYLKELSFEIYNDKHNVKLREKVELPDWKGPIVKDVLGNFSLANNYLISEYGKREERTLAIDMPKQFFYSGSMDSWDNLLRHSGYTNEKGFTYKNLEFETSIMTSTTLDGDEWEVLGYLYDHMPYAIQFAGRNWVGALLEANRGPRKVIDYRYVKPMELFSREQYKLSRNVIPFEIEGEFIVTDLENLKSIICMYRNDRPPFLYTYGECDNALYPIYHLLLREKGGKKDEEIVNFFKNTDLKKLIQEIRYIREETRPEKIEKDYEILFYYASSDERKELETKFHESEGYIEKISLMAQLGTRELFYQQSLLMTDRAEANQNYLSFLEKEKELLSQLNMKYGTNISMENEWDPLGYKDIMEDEEDIGFDMFDIPEEEETPIQEITDIPNTRYEVTHYESIEDWKEAQREGGTLPARQIWDPGGTGSQIIKRVK